MKKLNKKGFTLIELMAVVIVLIIIIFLAINKISKSTKETKDNVIKANAIAYMKAINAFIDTDSLVSTRTKSATFDMSDLEEFGINVSGTKPDKASVLTENYDIFYACFIYGSKRVTYDGSEYTVSKSGDCVDLSTDFAYTGKGEVFDVPITGNYKIELWGAGGGKGGATFGGANLDNAGFGGYTYGEITLNKGEKIYVYVGKQGNQGVTGNSSMSGRTFNGGGSGAGASDNDDAGGSGGGATDVRLIGGAWDNSESLASRIMVAAGGAGAPVIGKSTSYHGGHGGGLTGAGNIYRWENSLVSNSGFHATQTTGYEFGKGQDAVLGIACAGSGGGGGYWGGKAQTYTNSCGSHGGGGSSYISGYTGCVAIKSKTDTTPKDGCIDGTTDPQCSIHYSKRYFENPVMKSGIEEMPTTDGLSTMVGNEGDGYARIQFIR